MATEELSDLGAVIKEAYEGQENTNAYTDFDKAKVAASAPLASPTFTGDPKAPTPTAGDNDTSIATTAFVKNAIDTATSDTAPLESPAFTGNPTAPTPTAGDNDTSIATTAFVTTAVGTATNGLAPLASPTFTGNPAAPTPTQGDNDTSIATTAFVTTAVAAAPFAPLASPAFTGNPTAPTPTAGDNDTSIATTAFVTTAVNGLAPLASPTFTGNPAAPTPTAGDNDTSIATTAFVTTAVNTGVNGLAPLASPTFTGDPKAPTAADGDNDTSIATTGFVQKLKALLGIWTRQQVVQGTDLVDAASIAWDLDVQPNTSLLMTSAVGNTRALANPTNMKKHGTYIIYVKQDATGSRALTYGTAYKWLSGTAPVLSTAANAIDILTFYSDGTNMFGVISKGFA